MSQVTTRIENLERDKADKQTVDELRARIEELTAENIQQNHEGAQSISQEEVTRVVREELAEKEQIEAKKLYLIIQNIPEYNEEEDQPKSDSQKVQELLEQLDTPASLTSVTRMGKPTAEHPRTLKSFCEQPQGEEGNSG